MEENHLPEISQELLRMEAKGGEQTIQFKDYDWEIVSVTRTKDELELYGKTSTNNISRNNTQLSLQGLGYLESNFNNKGFKIDKFDPFYLKITLQENFEELEFCFYINIKLKNQYKTITVIQEPSAGYSIDRIDYKIGIDDGIKLYYETIMNYTVNNTRESNFQLNTLNGLNLKADYQFIPDNNLLFKLTNANYVNIPTGITDGKLNSESEIAKLKSFYSKPIEIQAKEEKLQLPAGESKFSVQAQLKKTQLSFLLKLKNNRTGELRDFRGKWIETKPTGKYKIKWNK
jgi:hypothetical protein